MRVNGVDGLDNAATPLVMSAEKVMIVPESVVNELHGHLQSWGLRRFAEEAAYYQWQQDSLTHEQISKLNQFEQERRSSDDAIADIRFYDLAADPRILPVLYTQRYEFYLVIGHVITSHIQPAQRVLDFGCGVGILTTFFASCFPDIEFVGIDRSSASIAIAREQVEKRGLTNLQFEQWEIPKHPISGYFDLILSTHALFQAEQNPGLPSINWKTFNRAEDSAVQVLAESRIGLTDRLESLGKALLPQGRMLLCEKAIHLGRRILLQRALSSRGYHLLSEPFTFRYRAIDEMIDDGPLYEITRESKNDICPWPEQPSFEKGQSLFACQGSVAEDFVSCLTDSEIIQKASILNRMGIPSLVVVGRWESCLAYGYVKTSSGFYGVIIGSLEDEHVVQEHFEEIEDWTEENLEEVMKRLWPHLADSPSGPEEPCYENHTMSAQEVWVSLPHRQVQKEATFQENGGREMHIEFGACHTLGYLYWANTFDQRQLVMVPVHRLSVLEDYYHESISQEDSGLPNNPTSHIPH